MYIQATLVKSKILQEITCPTYVGGGKIFVMDEWVCVKMSFTPNDCSVLKNFNWQRKDKRNRVESGWVDLVGVGGAGRARDGEAVVGAGLAVAGEQRVDASEGQAAGAVAGDDAALRRALKDAVRPLVLGHAALECGHHRRARRVLELMLLDAVQQRRHLGHADVRYTDHTLTAHLLRTSQITIRTGYFVKLTRNPVLECHR